MTIERRLRTTRFGVGSVTGRLRLLFIGTLTGIMGGMGTFLFINPEFFPLGYGGDWGLLIIGVAGVYTHVIAADLEESVSAAIVAFFIGVVVHVAASLAPLWIFSYHPFAIDLLLPIMLGHAWVGSIFGYSATFFGSYCAAVLADGSYKP